MRGWSVARLSCEAGTTPEPRRAVPHPSGWCGVATLGRSFEETSTNGTPGETQGRKATGPRFLRDETATKDPRTAELPKGGRRESTFDVARHVARRCHVMRSVVGRSGGTRNLETRTDRSLGRRPVFAGAPAGAVDLVEVP